MLDLPLVHRHLRSNPAGVCSLRTWMLTEATRPVSPAFHFCLLRDTSQLKTPSYCSAAVRSVPQPLSQAYETVNTFRGKSVSSAEFASLRLPSLWDLGSLSVLAAFFASNSSFYFPRLTAWPTFYWLPRSRSLPKPGVEKRFLECGADLRKLPFSLDVCP